MHQPIEDGLEDFLSGKVESDRYQGLERHLAVCTACRDEVGGMVEQVQLLRTLRAPEQAEPAAGFYARVMERIEAQSGNSFWSIFLEPAFGRRLMYASLALFVLLSYSVFQTTPGSLDMEGNPMTIMAGYDLPSASGNDPHHDREVVLVNLATYSTGATASALPVSSD
ncbi:hypothetical protein [uncultured Paludibaculum sp.]|uniref:anti-sigma factor family protein n=1 Tax=uncultured Paludibaculum sp. TaxID=1765020 RepID=UPI002AAC2C30|nr:hypothetical protein [uncultured Paludibaculum sp.]